MTVMNFSPPDFSCGVHQLAGIEYSFYTGFDYSVHPPKKRVVKRRDAIKNILKIVASRKTHCIEDSEEGYTEDCVFVLFSDAVENKYGAYLAAYIRKHKLGDVVASKKEMNPNSGRKIQVWIWTVDWNAVKTHLLDEFECDNYSEDE